MTWMQTIKGQRFSMVNPDPSQVDFEEVAESLGKLARFNGHTAGYPGYSVAQHCVLGAEGVEGWTTGEAHAEQWPGQEAIEYGRRYAALFLLHDAHEAYTGDITTPVVQALDHIRWPDGPPGNSGLVKQLVDELKLGLDLAIYEAAGIDPPSHTERAIIKNWDARMMAAERLAFMAGEPEPWPGMSVEPAPVDWSNGCIHADLWHPETAAREWLWAFEQYVRRAA